MCCSWIILLLLFCNNGCGCNNAGRSGNSGCGNSYDDYDGCGCNGTAGQNNGRGYGRASLQNDCGCNNNSPQNDCGCGNSSAQNGNCGCNDAQNRRSREDFPSYGGNDGDCGCSNN